MARYSLPVALLTILTLGLVPAADPPPAPKLPATAAEMREVRTDVWAEAALRQPGGPSYRFFRDMMPPLRYVNTAFRHYPIVLSAPLAPVKARFVSNGSGINLRADKPPMWKEAGVPVTFFVGDKAEPFGADVERLTGPHAAREYPMYGVHYTSGGTKYDLAVYPLVTGPHAEFGVVCVNFRAADDAVGKVVIRIDGDSKAEPGMVFDAKGRLVIQHGPMWKWELDKKELVCALRDSTIESFLVFTKPPATRPVKLPSIEFSGEEVIRTTGEFTDLLGRGTRLIVPERIVQDAWRAQIVGQYMTAVGDRMHYSAGNAYDHLYEAECGDAVRSLLLFGQTADARKMVGPLLDFNRQVTRFHVAGHKLQLLAHYYWVTRDSDYLRETRAKWEAVVQFVRDSRKEGEHGLLPKDRYAGDINEMVYSLNSNSACWRGLRDMAAVLDDLGEKEKAAELHKEATAFRAAILAAVDRSQDVTAKFIPVSLLSGEKPHDPLTATRTGSYYDLIIPYVLGSGVFGPGDPREGWIIDYLRNHGGLAMGMIRSTPAQGEFKDEPGVNVLYGLRYNLTILKRGDRDLALCGFYGHLAQGMTRDTFIGGEGSRFFHGDKHGRSFYLPPNTASNATFLTTLRYLLIQDWDLDDDSKPETLRLCDAIPPRWLADGQSITVGKAPTMFGEVSFTVKSQLAKGEVLAEVTAPPRPVGKWTLRLPDPPGYAITGVTIGDTELKRDADGRVDLTGRTGTFTVRFAVEKKN
jgi:hypothetical protein